MIKDGSLVRLHPQCSFAEMIALTPIRPTVGLAEVVNGRSIGLQGKFCWQIFKFGSSKSSQHALWKVSSTAISACPGPAMAPPPPPTRSQISLDASGCYMGDDIYIYM